MSAERVASTPKSASPEKRWNPDSENPDNEWRNSTLHRLDDWMRNHGVSASDSVFATSEILNFLVIDARRALDTQTEIGITAVMRNEQPFIFVHIPTTPTKGDKYNLQFTSGDHLLRDSNHEDWPVLIATRYTPNQTGRPTELQGIVRRYAQRFGEDFIGLVTGDVSSDVELLYGSETVTRIQEAYKQPKRELLSVLHQRHVKLVSASTSPTTSASTATREASA